MAVIPKKFRQAAGVLTVLLLGLMGAVWVGANPVGGGVLIALSFIRLVTLVRELRADASDDELRARLAQLDREIAEADAPTLEADARPDPPDAPSSEETT